MNLEYLGMPQLLPFEMKLYFTQKALGIIASMIASGLCVAIDGWQLGENQGNMEAFLSPLA